ncbi:sugar transferase [Shimia sp. CNT1-13L.2]|uniref:sugar transferase n=1 Tax=Shimia sp. CNT1-13L.2 TaxID=2959663 RepID=UPI0020CF3B43|nr:sugar transferase [Shimia sp. CNT1-13L.2]MCP9481137.1 sugar transferase [Shimia sp. CNT1-13L.2]
MVLAMDPGFAKNGAAPSQAVRKTSARDVMKRMLDLAFASIVVALVSPLIIAVVAIIKITSPGPAFFRQTRVGRHGETFEMLKFRSMYIDAEARRAALLEGSDRSGVCFKQKSDPRVTPIGRFIRRYSIDELPQVLNVLKGDMSLVGPRPALPEEVAQYSEEARGRLEAVPGMTGLWQVSGRADVGFERMVKMDIAYAKTHNVFLDLLIMALTFRAVLSARGAY